MNTNKMATILERLNKVYKDEAVAKEALDKIIDRFKNKEIKTTNQGWVSEKDTMLITYGDSIQKEGEMPLTTLNNFMKEYVGDAISSVHILPMFPYTSDDGFSVVDYKQVDPNLGGWKEVNELSENYKLMFDAVINHMSKSSDWFKGFLAGDEKYKDYFIVADPNEDYSKVTRPRALPLLTAFDTNEGVKHVWTTFSEDQIDLNYRSIDLLVDMIDVLISYAENGSKYIRLDAIGFMWKEKGTTCMHLEETHELIKVMREVLEVYVPGTILITETNVPHKDNISYFGNGHDEAQMVYQFPLPPLTLFSFLTGDATKLSNWAASLEPLTEDTTYFNFLASHDGIGMRPTEGILTQEEKELLVETTLKNGGRVSFKNNGDGTKSPYELNINYQDALTSPNAKDEERIKRFVAAQTVLLSVVGVPGIYVHSLLGSRNYYYGAETSGINRRINREKLNVEEVIKDITSDTARKTIFEELLNRIEVRKQETAFSPIATQEVLSLDKRVFSIVRHNQTTGDKVLVLINVSNEEVKISTNCSGTDLFSKKVINDEIILAPLQTMWVKCTK